MPVTVNGTVTAWPLKVDSWAVMVAVPAPSETLCAAVLNWTVGMLTSLSVMVMVWTFMAPTIALVGAPIVTIKVSVASLSASSNIVTVMFADIDPAGMVIGLAVMV